MTSASRLKVTVDAVAVKQWIERFTTHLKVVGEVADERSRQVAEEGHSFDADDRLDRGQLGDMAAAYAQAATESRFSHHRSPPPLWPPGRDWKPQTRRSDLIRAAALCVAEVERIDRRAGVVARATVNESAP